MTSIKPPTGPSPGTNPGASGPAAGVPAAHPSAAQGVERARAFREAIEATGGPAPASPVGATTGVSGTVATGGDVAAAVVAELRAGRIDAAGAVERLVTNALSQAGASALPPLRRAELEALLREAVSSDPSLVQLRKDLERAR
jgi:hypothetical protein